MFDNSKVIMFDDWNVSFLRKNSFTVETEILLLLNLT